MAQNSRKSKSQTRRSSRDMEMDTDMEMDAQDYTSDDQDLDIEDATQSRSARGQGQQRQARQTRAGGRLPAHGDQPQDLISSIQSSIAPTLQEARKYVDGHPVRAAAIGAVAGGLLMTLFSTEKGRSFVRMAYDYANPMVAKYAREYVSRAAGDLAENAVSQH